MLLPNLDFLSFLDRFCNDKPTAAWFLLLSQPKTIIAHPLRIQTVSSGIEEMNQTPFPSSRRLFFSRYYLLWSISLFVYLYALFFCLSTPPTPPSSTTSTVFSFSLSTMASSSRNPNPITALDDEDSLVDEFDHISIPSPSSPHKKNPFEISNSIPLEEFFPRIRTRTDDQDLQQAINQFLHVESPTSTPVSLTTQVPASCTQPSLFISTLPMPHSSPLPTPQTLQTSIPPPIMSDSVTTHAAKGKAIALSRTSHPFHFRGSNGVVINEPCPTISIAISPATRATFTREHSQVEDFDYTEAQLSYTADQSNSKATPISQHIQRLQTIGFQEDSPALYVDAAFDKKNALTGTSFIFKIGCQHPLSPKFVFSDCLNLVSKVNSEWHDHSALSGLVSRIRLLFSNFPEASLHFLPRQLNMAAHGLAKEALRLREEV
ncbi:hypothetical protein F8388_003313 [Cannabis sativa]|uniref:RNase H type-1 domain-containing protein n=1 Tax=Cannabis sativa TaxID=3483 RepID=A0A7J6DLR2_CANSA|nr:hypothetical protein G4B88_003581 [Cannabis sativa]KAF4357166.1 hypothetical protein F8388_003313 [Cannabis sativa]